MADDIARNLAALVNLVYRFRKEKPFVMCNMTLPLFIQTYREQRIMRIYPNPNTSVGNNMQRRNWLSIHQLPDRTNKF